MQHIQAVVFDLDGTLVSSSLDFEAMRYDLGCPPTEDILAFLAQLPAEQKPKAAEIVREHEMRDAESSFWLPAAKEFVEACNARSIPMAIVTRNSAIPTQVKLARNGIPIQPVFTREMTPPKPDPAAILTIAEQWRLPTSAVMMVGDYKYDLQAGRNANAATCLVNFAELPAYASELADYTFANFAMLHSAFFVDR